MTTTLTIAVDDFTPIGATPAVGTKFRLNGLSTQLGVNGRITSTKKWWVLTSVEGDVQTQIPDSQPGEALMIGSNLPGWQDTVVAGYPSGVISLSELVAEYGVEPRTLKRQEAVPAWWLELKRLVRTVNGKAPDARGNVQISATAGVYEEHVQVVASAEWSIPHGFGRVPSAQVRDEAGNVMLADVKATETLVLVTHASPRVGSVTLT
jgi:hypothetical protein